MAAQLNRFDCDHFTEDEELLASGLRLEDVGRHIVARTTVELEETAAVESTRPTVPVFLGEPWR